jgi:hypothetical protein
MDPMNASLALFAVTLATLVAWALLARRRARCRRAATRDNLERWPTRRSLHPGRGGLPFGGSPPVREGAP